MKVDLDELERKARAAPLRQWRWGTGGDDGRVSCLYDADRDRRLPVITLDIGSMYLTLATDCEHIAANGPPVTLALIGRIRLLEASLRGAASIIEGAAQAHSQHDDYHDDLDWKAAQAMRRILENGVEIPPA